MRASDRLVWYDAGIIALYVWTNVTYEVEVLSRPILIDDTPLKSILLYVLLSNCNPRFWQAYEAD